MTTEIAVINRLGVVLATDSAVTISGGGKSKVFDTGDKLFELSEIDSVGVMINGNMDLLGVPWEILIKDFRASRPIKASRSMKDWMQCLFDFAAKHKVLSSQSETDFVESIARNEFAKIKRRVSQLVMSMADSKSVDVVKMILSAAQSRRDSYAELGVAESLATISRDEVRKKHIRKINGLITASFDPVVISNVQRAVLRRLVVDALFSAQPSDWSTGLIIGGYGDGDMFPSIAIAEVEGSVGGVIKYSHSDHIVIDRRNNPGRIISFAQTDVIDRILSGADARFIDKSTEYIEEAIGGAKDAIVKLISDSGVDATLAEAIFNDVIETVSTGYKDEFAKTAREDFQGDFNEMVALMPKQDIIELAEAMVSITAVERKASSEQATVGGPIDVAFITKHEGFVWIKRKHYFDGALNPRYFWRKKLELRDGLSQEKPGGLDEPEGH